MLNLNDALGFLAVGVAWLETGWRDGRWHRELIKVIVVAHVVQVVAVHDVRVRKDLKT